MAIPRSVQSNLAMKNAGSSGLAGSPGFQNARPGPCGPAWSPGADRHGRPALDRHTARAHAHTGVIQRRRAIRIWNACCAPPGVV